MDRKPLWSMLVELAASGLVLYSSLNPDTNLAALFWHTLWHGAQAVARTAGRLAMRAELRYFAVVQA